MKNRLLLVVALIATTFLSTTAVAQDDYDFSAAAPSGQTLYYKISDSNNVTVAFPGFYDRYYGYLWDEYPQPSGDLTIPGTVLYNGNSYAVSAIGDGSFAECNGLTSVTIPNSVTSIGDHAFHGSALTSVTIPNSVTSIGNYAFSGNALTSIVIPNSVTTIGHEAFCYCDSLTSVTISNSVTSIGSFAFYGCTRLTSITIPNSVISIGRRAFAYCHGLTSVTIPASVTYIGESLFCGCKGLTSIVVQDGNSTYDSRNNCNAIIETATNTLIASCSSTIIPNTVTSIGDYAFSHCPGLTSVAIPNSVTSIGEGAFSDCGRLTSVTIPNSVTTIGDKAFWACRVLTSVTIPNSITTIGDYVFWKCLGLTSVTIPNSVTSIGNYAFEECSGLTSVTIGNSVASIGNHAFCYCTGLTSITCLAQTAPVLGDNAFNKVVSTIPVKIPRKSILSYLSRWSYFSNFVALGSDGIDDAEAVETRIYQHNGQVVVEGAEGSKVTLYDATGRLLSTKTDEYDQLHFDVPASGAYLIKIGRHAPRKVVVIK